jgi:hypothetical protein
VEVIIASSIFTIVSLIGVTVFINVTRIQRKIALENAIYEDGRFMMERISREIRANTVDYEEYYNKLVEGKHYGEEYTCYASRFYNPGTDGTGAAHLGALCSDPPLGDPLANPGCVIDKTTLDVNTGRNPYSGNIFAANKDPEDANAFCDQQFGSGTTCGADATLHDQSELYLINAKGTKKTILARKQVNASPDERSLAMVQIEGDDLTNDSIVDEWVNLGMSKNFHCSANYDCPISLTDLESSLVGTTAATRYVGFVPISPMRTVVKDLRFYVSPLEDPRKAFAETTTTDAIQQQPHITIVMVLQPSASEMGSFGGEVPTITLQNTVSSRVYNEVKSYTGIESCSTDYFPLP